METHAFLLFSETEVCLTLVSSKTLDSDLGMFIPKWGLDNATADEFAKTNKIKTIDEDKSTNPTQIKT